MQACLIDIDFIRFLTASHLSSAVIFLWFVVCQCELCYKPFEIIYLLEHERVRFLLLHEEVLAVFNELVSPPWEEMWREPVFPAQAGYMHYVVVVLQDD